MPTITNAGKWGTVLRCSLMVALIVSLGIPLYMYYRSSDSCRVLESISNDPKLNVGLKDALIEYLKQDRVQAFLKRSSGTVFSISDFGVPFNYLGAFEVFDVQNPNLQLVMKKNSSGQIPRFPYDITEVGIGYSRAYLMFARVSQTQEEDFSNDELALVDDSYVDCRVYD